MALPDLLLPPGVPNFVRASQKFGQLEVFGNVKRGTGADRKRRLKTKTPRVVDVASKKLSQAQFTALDDWYEDILLAGKRRFSVQLSNQGPGVLWWSARWVAPWKAEPSDGGWVITGQLHLDGDGSTDGPVLGALAFEYHLALEGKASLVADSSLAFEYFLRLRPDAPLAFEYRVALELPHFLERQDGTDFERESGGKIQREN